MPGAFNTYIFYVHSVFGPSYGTYFAMVPSDGTLRRWNGSGWDSIATGGNPTREYAYGRAGFETVHQIFYWINNPPEAYSNEAWETWVVRPYPYHDGHEPAAD